jgi:poly(3-hydroxybutyrate) depolymerase
MSGHHATLLRETVRDTLPYFDVYITDWIDANQIPITHGSFDLDDFIDYVINYIQRLDSDVHVLAVCQPTVPVMAAAAIMSANNDPKLPKSVILIGGPIDARKNPTKPNDFANDKNLQWFDSALVTSVPSNYPGYRRRVYPGFLQLAGFINMNLQNHVTSHVDLFENLIAQDDEKTQKHKKFYDEYLSVMDLTAEFYLQTIKEVFHDFSLAKGKFVSRGRKVDLNAITNCALMGIEGEEDDIAAVGQTKAALGLCKNIPDSKKAYYLQKGVGHYGSFSGSKFRNFIVPKIREFVAKNT